MHAHKHACYTDKSSEKASQDKHVWSDLEPRSPLYTVRHMDPILRSVQRMLPLSLHSGSYTDTA
jgi:hypothetical protein